MRIITEKDQKVVKVSAKSLKQAREIAKEKYPDYYYFTSEQTKEGNYNILLFKRRKT